MPKVLQAVIIVDVEGSIVDDEVLALLPDKRDERIVVSLAASGAPKVQRHGLDAQPVDWIGLGRAVEVAARTVREAATEKVLHLYIAGQGPLPIFTHLGYALSKFTGSQIVVGRRPSGPWELLPLGATDAGVELLSAGRLRTDPSHATGRVAVYIDVAGRPVNMVAVRSAVEAQGDRLADVVEIRSVASLTVDARNAPQLAHELIAKIARLPALYPHASGLSLFVAGPTVLAVCVGRALNPSIVPVAWLSNYNAGTYDPVYSLPFIDGASPPLPDDDASVAARAALKGVLAAAIEELKVDLVEDDLGAPLPIHERAAFLAHLKALQLEDAVTVEFSLSIAQGRYALGDGLLEALRNGEHDTQLRFAKLLMLHELFHEHQGVRSTNYFDVGRAGVVLESVDFTADMFALRVLVNCSFRTGGAAAEAGARGVACQWIDAILFGIQAFDLLDGPRIQQLPDRRLRRYLTWYLQRARAETVDTVADVAVLLAASLTAELAPITAMIDRRSDRIVVAATPMTEFFAAVDGRLVRHAKRPGFEPGELVEAVRGFSTAAIQKAMRFVIEEDKAKLIPWRA